MALPIRRPYTAMSRNMGSASWRRSFAYRVKRQPERGLVTQLVFSESTAIIGMRACGLT